MVFHKIIFITIFFVSQISNAQTNSRLVSDKEIYDFLNYITKFENKYREEPRLTLKYISDKIIPWEKEDFIRKDSNSDEKLDPKYVFKKESGIDTIFNAADRQLLIDQSNGITTSVWQKKFKHSILAQNEKENVVNRHSYSIPLFSADRKHVILKRKYYCGEGCCYYGYCIYRKNKKGTWDFVSSYNCGK